MRKRTIGLKLLSGTVRNLEKPTALTGYFQLPSVRKAIADVKVRTRKRDSFRSEKARTEIMLSALIPRAPSGGSLVPFWNPRGLDVIAYFAAIEI